MSSSSRRLLTERLLLTRPAAGDSAGLLAYRQQNRAHLEPWEPQRTEQFYTMQAVEERLRQMAEQVEENLAVYWLLRFPQSADIFNVHGLHRIMANYQSQNSGSEKLLCRLGFEREGLARKYLKIGGEWADHVLTSFINPLDG